MKNNFKELKVWQKAILFSKEIYVVTKSFPDSEKFGITSQLQRSAVSVAANIAEGAGRGYQKDFSRFLSIAIGSSYEAETLLVISQEVGYLSKEDFERLSSLNVEIQKMTVKLIDTLVST